VAILKNDQLDFLEKRYDRPQVFAVLTMDVDNLVETAREARAAIKAYVEAERTVERESPGPVVYASDGLRAAVDELKRIDAAS
jgi:CRISPR/Cas system-associated protein Cas10 (large subunit of type III CRISPR-Cas system)